MLDETLEWYFNKYLRHCNLAALRHELGISQNTFKVWEKQPLNNRKNQHLQILTKFSLPRTEITLKEEKPNEN